MENDWLTLILIVLTSVAIIIFLIIKNHKDRKSLFKKMPGDYPDPKNVKSEFDRKD